MDIAIHNSKKKVSVSDDAFAASFQRDAGASISCVIHGIGARRYQGTEKSFRGKRRRCQALAAERYRPGKGRHHS